MRKLILFMALFVMLFLNIDWIELPQTDINLFDCKITESNVTEIIYTSDDYEQETITVNDIYLNKIFCVDRGEDLQKGKPSLPQFARLLSVHKDSKLFFLIARKSEQVVNNVVIYHSQELLTESRLQKLPFSLDESNYQSDKLFPQSKRKYI